MQYFRISLPSIFVLIVIITMFSFAPSKTHSAKEIAGVYGVENCSPNNNNSPRLTLNSDSTFTYIERQLEQTNVHGTWTVKNNVIFLTQHGTDVKIHTHWHYKSKHLCITSRKGMAFYRLCRIANCP